VHGPAAAAVDVEPKPRDQNGDQAAQRGAIRILLVDDHHDTNRAMARLLQRLGYEVHTADSVRSALEAAAAAEAAEEHGAGGGGGLGGGGDAGAEGKSAHGKQGGQGGFDLLISDIGLPDGSGLDLMRLLLQRRPIKGIALSGFGMEEDVKKSKEAGFYEHLIKPINFNRLESAIRDLTGGADPKPDPPSFEPAPPDNSNEPPMTKPE
jgi:CheY-like chemotaxis protein